MRNAADGFEGLLRTVVERAQAEGVLPWQRPTRDGAVVGGAPVNAVTGKAYRGVNRWLLRWTGARYFAGAGQWRKVGATVTDRSAAVTVWIPARWRTIIDRETGKVVGRVPFKFKAGTVYPASAVTGWTAPAAPAVETVDADAAADAIVDAMPNAPTILHRDGAASGSYSPTLDAVLMPHRNACRSAARYYKTLFHELAHSTGHVSRIGRDEIGTSFGSHEYSREELVAEFAAALLADECGMSEETLDNSAAYVQHWLQFIASDPSVLSAAAADAEKAVAFILGNGKRASKVEPTAAAS